MPIISVIVPVYNAEKYVSDCIDSILNQTFSDFELLLIDDGSTDSSGAICDEYVKRDNRIRVFHQSNHGQAASRNFAVKQSESEWIHFVDSDDIIHPQMLETLLNLAKENNARISTSSAIEKVELPQAFFDMVNPEGRVIEIDEAAMLDLYKKVPYIYWIACTKLIKKDIVLKYPFTPGRVYEDNAVVCRWLYEAGKIAITDEQLYFYRVNPDGTTKKKFSIKHCDLLWAFKEQIEFFKTTPYKELLSELCIRYLNTFNVFYHDLKKMDAESKMFASRLRIQALFYWISNFRIFVKGKSDLVTAILSLFPEICVLLSKIKQIVRK